MNQKLQQLLDSIAQSAQLSDDEKNALAKTVKEVDKEIDITTLKLDSTEKVKRTTAILLEETTKELEKKRKAVEAQKRELQIESSLERVRTVAMSMNKPDDMLEVCKTISLQLQSLGVKEIRNVQTAIFYEAKGSYMNYEFYAKHDKTFVTDTLYTNHKIAKDFAERMLKGSGEIYSTSIKGSEVKDWLEYQKTTNVFIDTYLENADSLNYYWHSLGPVALGISTYHPLSEDELHLFQRFLKVFDLSYRRYLDIEKAIAQAREAQIETALEKVRAKTMGMQKSEELADVIWIIFEQFIQLGIPIASVGYNLDYRHSDDFNLWIASQNQTNAAQIHIPYFDHPIFNEFRDAKKNGLDFYTVNCTPEVRNIFYKYFYDLYPDTPDEMKEFVYSSPGYAHSVVLLKDVSLYIQNLSGVPFSDADNSILMRFARVFEQTYTRFTDLKQAEAQAREAQIEASLERVRSRTLAMQKSDELADTAAVLFQQLIHLGIAPNRLYLSIISNDQKNNEFWITGEDGTKVNKHVIGDINENPTIQTMYKGWKAKERSLTIDMQGEELAGYLQYLGRELNIPFKQGPSVKRRVQTIAYYSKGFLGIGSPDEQPEETILLLERFAAAFNLTYIRFNDLKIAEAHAIQAQEDLIKLQTEKQRAEDALTELRATQKQLIQSEKMASLGELTAGIAHEIQNPLNFVNNFSEVSNELMDEMNAEIAKGDFEEAKLIANDIKQNLEKINHHGKRADAIVKGMLQHSRSSSGTKEPTDINKLADEYLRLAYHGLRAKDKSFNAIMKTDFDESIGNINIIPQDIGRVILNLITNAFYAASLHPPTGEGFPDADYKHNPTVYVSTKKMGDEVFINVQDNGPGIPQKILDKIFQPFFTTKPTGKGTGLGLSLSYDIVKAHGGDLKVKTKEHEGSEFIIQLPIN
jgi:signal transduction histidine kinase